jgi:hypothetical protein
VDVFTVHPVFINAVVEPGGQVIGNFTINAFNRSYKGPIIVTTTLWIWFFAQMNRPQQVQRLSAIVSGVSQSPYQQTAWIGLGLTIISAVCVTLFLFRRSKRTVFGPDKARGNPPSNFLS